MVQRLRFIIVIFISIFLNFYVINSAIAQNVPPLIAKLNLAVDSLNAITGSTANAKTDEERTIANTAFNKTFINALKVQNSFLYDGFDSLQNVSVLKSPDQLLKIFTWFLPKLDGTYQYFGVIQMNTRNGVANLITLTDDTANFKDLNAITSSKNWLGARYYELIPVTAMGKPPYYLLLGWKGNNEKSTKKIIDVLTITNNEASFGKNIFETVKNAPLKNRVIFEYNKLNTMTLTFNKTAGMLVFDHLAPFDKSYTGNFEFYASDSTFDGYQIVYGKLSLKEDVELKNDPSKNDEFYGTPVKATTLLRGNH